LDRGLSTNVMHHFLFVGPPLIISESELMAGLSIIDGLLAEIDQEIA
jgi:hypothetical protein